MIRIQRVSNKCYLQVATDSVIAPLINGFLVEYSRKKMALNLLEQCKFFCSHEQTITTAAAAATTTTKQQQ